MIILGIEPTHAVFRSGRSTHQAISHNMLTPVSVLVSRSIPNDQITNGSPLYRYKLLYVLTAVPIETKLQ